MDKKKELSLKLQEIGAIKFGEFKLKDGSMSPIYIDLRILVSFPDVLKLVSDALVEEAKDLKYDRVAGIPYAALPIATAFSLQTGKPMVYPRKEVKDYGTKKQVEGLFNEGETVLLIDDLITKGLSKIEAVAPLREAGLQVKDIVVLIDREQGGKLALETAGYNLKAVLKITELLNVLKENKKIEEEKFNEVMDYLKK